MYGLTSRPNPVSLPFSSHHLLLSLALLLPVLTSCGGDATGVQGLNGTTAGSTTGAMAPAAVLVTSGSGQTATVGEVPADPLVAQVRDRRNQPVSGMEVRWTIVRGGGGLSQTSSITDKDGFARQSGWRLGTQAGLNEIQASVAGVGSTAFTATGAAGAVARVRVEPGSVEVLEGGSVQLSALAEDEYGNPRTDATFSWASDNAQIVLISGSGRATGRKAGRAQIDVRSGQGSGSAWVQVLGEAGGGESTVATLNVSPSVLSFNALGQSASLAAVPRDASGTLLSWVEVSWQSQDPTVASVDGFGTVTAMKAGSTGIVASTTCCGSVTATVPVTVTQAPQSLLVSPTSLSLTVGESQGLFASLRDGDGRAIPGASFTWSSADPQVATVGIGGVVTAVASGSTRIRASSAGLMGEATVTVAPSPDGPGDPSAITDLTADEATATTVTLGWTEVQDGSGNPASYALRYGFPPLTWDGAKESETLLVPGVPGAHRTQVIADLQPDTEYEFMMVPYWDSEAGTQYGSPSNVAAARTHPQDGGGSGVASVTATPSSLAFTALGDSIRVTATARDAAGQPAQGAAFVWTSANPVVASVNASGTVKAKAAGATFIVVAAACCSWVADTVPVSVTQAPDHVSLMPSSMTVAPGSSKSLTASLLDRNDFPIQGSQFSWTSGNEHIARVDGVGSVTGVEAGSTWVRATAQGKSSTAPVTVTTGTSGGQDPLSVTDLRVVATADSSVTLRWTEAEDGAGNPVQYAVRRGSPTISWSEAATTSVYLQGEGVGRTMEYQWRGLKPGTAYQFQLVPFWWNGSSTVYGELSNIASATTTGSGGQPPTQPHVATVKATPDSTRLVGVGQTTQFTATARDASGNVVPGTSFTWQSLNPAVATVNTSGLVTSRALGVALITVGTACCSDTTMVRVEAPPPPGSVASVIALPPSMTFTGANQTQKITATAKDAQGNALSGISFTYNSLTPSVATVDGSGNVTSKAFGTALITVATACCSDTVNVAVNQQTLPSGVWFEESWNFASTTDLRNTAGGWAKDGNIFLDTGVTTPWGGSKVCRLTITAQDPIDFHAGAVLRPPRASIDKPREIWIEFYIKYDPNWFVVSDHKTIFVMENWSAGGGADEVNRWDTYVGGGFATAETIFTPAGMWMPPGSNKDQRKAWLAANVWNGQWHTLRQHYRMQDDATGQGSIAQIWLDGTLIKEGYNYDRGTPSYAYFDKIILGANGDIQSAPSSMYWGRVQIYTTNPGW